MRLGQHTLTVLALLVVALDLSARPAHAYLDPGVGSYAVQVAIAGMAGALFALRTFWGKLQERGGFWSDRHRPTTTTTGSCRATGATAAAKGGRSRAGLRKYRTGGGRATVSEARRCLPEPREEHQQPDEQLYRGDAARQGTGRARRFPIHTPYSWQFAPADLEWFPKRGKKEVTEL